MRKTTAVLLVMMMAFSLAACGGKGEKAAGDDLAYDIYQANLTEALLPKYETVSRHTTWYDEDGSYDEEETIAVRENCLYVGDNGGNYYECDIEGRTVKGYSEEAGGAHQYINCDVENFNAMEGSLYASVSLQYHGDERVESVTEDDGVSTVLTSLDKKTVEEVFGDSAPAMESGDKVISELIVDTETLELQALNSYILCKDGSKRMINESVITYNGGLPEAPQEYKDAFSDAGTRTVTITSDPGTKEELVTAAVVAKGIRADIYLPEGYEKVYADEACTQVFQPDETFQNDTVLYLTKGK